MGNSRAPYTLHSASRIKDFPKVYQRGDGLKLTESIGVTKKVQSSQWYSVDIDSHNSEKTTIGVTRNCRMIMIFRGY